MERPEIAMVVAHNIQSAMDRRNLNPASLARLAKTNPTGIYDILSGKSQSPRLDTLDKIARALEMPLVALLVEQSAEELRNQIMEAVASLPEADQMKILTTARAWAADHGSE